MSRLIVPRLVMILLAGSVAAGSGLRAQEPREQLTGEQQPTFRAGVDLIELDISVLDNRRRPVEGLTAADFTVLEDGKPQRIVTVSHVDVADHDPARSARMRYVAPDVAANDLADQVGPGRLVAIVFDDMNLPADDPDIVRAARETARYAIDQLGPSDMAAVVYSRNAGRTQDFTSDRARLLEAIDKFQPSPSDGLGVIPDGLGGGSGDMLQQWSPTLRRSSCMRAEPAVPTLDTVASRLATVPGRRKALLFIGVGIGVSLSGGDSCGSMLAEVMKEVFRTAQRANINIYPINPVSPHAYQQYLMLRRARRAPEDLGVRRRSTDPRLLREFQYTIAENTGGRVVLETDGLEPTIDRIFEEDRSFYLLGYESANPRPDGRFRRVEVRVNRPGLTVRGRSGYWAATANDPLGRRPDGGPTSPNAAMAGLRSASNVRLRAHVVPVARTNPAPGQSNVDVTAVLTVRYPPLRAPASDRVTIVSNVYDEEGRPGPPKREVVTVDLQPGGGDEVPHDIVRVYSLEPGPHQIRFNVQSTLLGASGSLFADVHVPDFARSLISLSGLVLGRSVASGADAEGAVASLPLVPTSARAFAPGDDLHAFVVVHQGEGATPSEVAVTTEIFDADDLPRHAATAVLPADSFVPGRGSPYQFEVPLAGLASGPHLLTITARLPGGRTARRDVVIRIR